MSPIPSRPSPPTRGRRRFAPLLAGFLPFFAAACGGGGGGGGGIAPPVVDEGSFSPADFQHTSTHGPDDPPLRSRVVSIVSNEELAILDPTGLHQGLVADYNEPHPPFTSVPTTTVEPATFARAASGQVDADPEEDFLTARFEPWSDPYPGRFTVAALRPDGTWEELVDHDLLAADAPVMATGDTDFDGPDEIVIAWGNLQDQVILEVFEAGAVVHTDVLFVQYPYVVPDCVELGLADIDADGRDEIVALGNRGPDWDGDYLDQMPPVVAVLDDATTGYALLSEMVIEKFGPQIATEGNRAQLVLGDFDSVHPGDEISVTRLAYYDFPDGAGGWHHTVCFQYEALAWIEEEARLERWCRGGEDTTECHMIKMHTNLGSTTYPPPQGLVGFDAIAGDLDGDRVDELISAWFTVGEGGSDGPGSFFVFNIDLARSMEEVEEHWSVPEKKEHIVGSTPYEWDGEDKGRVGTFTYLPNQHEKVNTGPPYPDFEADRWSLVAGDGNADGVDELHVALSNGGFTASPIYRCRVSSFVNGGKLGLMAIGYPMTALDTPPRLLHADWDNDDLRVRYTGNMELTMGDPVPIILMAAPPTKQGISQKYENSITEYTEGAGQGKTYAVTTGITASVWAGYEASDPLGIFSASGKLVLGSEYAWTEEEREMVVKCSGYAAPYDQDVIVFQGILRESYHYEVIAAGDDLVALGKIMSIDVPVDERLYVWGLETFNEKIESSIEIDATGLGHTIGDPASYMSKEDAAELVAGFPPPEEHEQGQGYIGWIGNEEVLANTGGYTFSKIAVDSETTLSEEMGWSVTYEQEFKAGGAVVGFSGGIFGDQVYGVTCADVHEYYGRVGGVVDFAEWSLWNYDYGLVVYNRGLYLQNEGTPSLPNYLQFVEDDTVPYQVATYYTVPIGGGYAAH